MSSTSVELAGVSLVSIERGPDSVAGSTPSGTAHRIVVDAGQPRRLARGVGSNAVSVTVFIGNAPTGTSSRTPAPSGTSYSDDGYGRMLFDAPSGFASSGTDA